MRVNFANSLLHNDESVLRLNYGSLLGICQKFNVCLSMRVIMPIVALFVVFLCSRFISPLITLFCFIIVWMIKCISLWCFTDDEEDQNTDRIYEGCSK